MTFILQENKFFYHIYLCTIYMLNIYKLNKKNYKLNNKTIIKGH